MPPPAAVPPHNPALQAGRLHGPRERSEPGMDGVVQSGMGSLDIPVAEARQVPRQCLEFGADWYTTRFGTSAVTKVDLLHIDDSNPLATVVADLTKPNDIPSDRFDCIVCTFVLHVIVQVKVQDYFAARPKIEAIVYGALKSLRGSVSAEHGIGLEKKPWLSISRSETQVAMMRAIKTALDPKNTLSPGNIF